MHDSDTLPGHAAQPAFVAPAVPPPLHPAPHSRLSSPSPARTPSAGPPHRVSHSRGRPRTLLGGSWDRERARSESRGPEGAASSWSERSESAEGSRAPLWRLHGASARGRSESRVGNGARGTVDEKERFREEEEQSRAVHKGNWAVRLARHFAGIRDHRAFPTPLLRPLRHLSPTTEGYLIAFLGSFPSILIASAISSGLSTIPGDAFSLTPLTVGSLGATAVLLYGVPEGPLSQPRNLIGGHVLSAIVGAVVSQLFSLSSRFTAGSEDVDNTVARIESWDALTPVAAALAVSLSLLVMQLTGTVHPPGGATALIAAYHRTSPARWTYLLDVFLAVSAMGVWAMLVVNLGRRRYPAYWWTPPATDRAAVIPPPSAPSAPLAPCDPVEPKGPTKRRPSPPSHLEHAPAFSPAEDLERRWLGRLGEVDEEALASGDERARREEGVWNAGKARMEEQEHEREQERGRRVTRGAY